MKTRTILFLIISLMLVIPLQINAEESSTESVRVYYFHGTRRCKTCKAIESNAKKALQEGFSEEMGQGVITWHAIDTDQKENAHFVKDFDLMFSSLILVKFKDGKQVEWKNLQKVWELVWDDTAYQEYVQKEMKAYLES